MEIALDRRSVDHFFDTSRRSPVGTGSDIGIPEGHGGEQDEDAGPEEFVSQTAGDPLTGSLLVLRHLTGVRAGRRGPPVGFHGPSGGNRRF